MAAQRGGVLFLKVICFSRRKHSHSVNYTESKRICPSLRPCLLSLPLTGTQLLRKCADIPLARVHEISCSLLLLATMFHALVSQGAPSSKLECFSFPFLYQADRGITLKKKIKKNLCNKPSSKVETRTPVRKNVLQPLFTPNALRPLFNDRDPTIIFLNVSIASEGTWRYICGLFKIKSTCLF